MPHGDQPVRFPIPALDLMEKPFGRGWMACCDFCHQLLHLDGLSHRAALEKAAGQGWSYTVDGYNACGACTRAGVK